MQLPTYLSLSRHNVYYYRFPLPKKIHPNNKSSHIRLSLSTTNERDALYTSNMLTYHANETLNTLQSTNMDYEEIRLKITERLTQLIKDSKVKRLKEGELTYQDRKNLEEWQDQYKRYKPDNYYEGDTLVSNANRHISNMFDNFNLNAEQHKKFVLEFIRQYPKALNEMLSFNKDPQDINFSIENNATVPKEQTSIEKTINSYIEEQLAGGNWETDTERERRKCFKALIDILGADFPTESLTKKLGREIKDIISGLPIRWTTQKETKNLSILEASKDKKLPKISVKTVNEYMSAYSTYGKWLEQRDYLDKNPFSYLTTKITSDEKARDDFSIDEMRLILNAIEHDKIKNSRKKSRYWGIMIAAYTGMRREEIAQLYVSDIKQENDIYYIDINKNTPDKRLKNKSSKRHMPIHQTIIDKGFIEYVEGLKANGIERIFPDLKAGEKHRYGRNLGEWFNGKFLKQLGIKTDKNAFHSFRHTVTTQLFEIGTQDSLVKKIRGSSVANDPTFNNYDHSTRLGLMKEALERLPY